MQRQSVSSSVPKMNRMRLLNFTPASSSALTANRAASSGPLSSCVPRPYNMPSASAGSKGRVPIRQVAGGHDVQVAQDTEHLCALADLSVTVVPAVAVVRAEPQIAGDLQGLAQCLIDGRAERIAACSFVAHTGYAHELAEGGLQRRVLGC